MCCPVAHLASDAGLVSEYVHAVGGVAYLLALVAAGFLAMCQGHIGARLAAALFATALAVGVLATPLIAEPVAVAQAGPVAALAFGAAVAASPRTPGWVTQLLVGGFGVWYGLMQGHHLLQYPADATGLSAVLAAAVAAGGSYAIGLTVGLIAEDRPAAVKTAVALGGVIIAVVILALAQG